MTSRLLMLLVLGLLTACVNPPEKVAKTADPCAGKQVHLHLYGAAKEAGDEIRTVLQKKGLEFCERSNGYPGAERDNLIIHAADKEGLRAKGSVIAALSESGVEIERRYSEAFGKHSYTEGNVGVYLFELQR